MLVFSYLVACDCTPLNTFLIVLPDDEGEGGDEDIMGLSHRPMPNLTSTCAHTHV